MMDGDLKANEPAEHVSFDHLNNLFSPAHSSRQFHFFIFIFENKNKIKKFQFPSKPALTLLVLACVH